MNGNALDAQTEKTWAMLAHLSQLLWLFTGLGGVIAPLVIWLVYRERSPYVEREAREALNFQITLLIAACVAGVLIVVLIGLVLLPLLALVGLVMPIIGAVKASEGVGYRYPLALRLIPGPGPAPAAPTGDGSAPPPPPSI